MRNKRNCLSKNWFLKNDRKLYSNGIEKMDTNVIIIWQIKVKHYHTYRVIEGGNEWHAGVDRRGFGTKQDFIPLFFFRYVQILWQGQKAVLTIVEFEFFDIFYSKFQLVSTFSICSNFGVENWLLCCDLICKWVTCRSGYKRFWKSALHIWCNIVQCNSVSFWLLKVIQFLLACTLLYQETKIVKIAKRIQGLFVCFCFCHYCCYSFLID